MCCQRGSRGKNCAEASLDIDITAREPFNASTNHTFLFLFTPRIILYFQAINVHVCEEGCWISKTKTNNFKLVFSSSEMISLVPVRNSNCLKTLNIKLATLTGLQS